MLVTTTPTVQGHEITKYLGVVCGEVVIGAHLGKDILASLTNLVGGRSEAYESTLRETRDDAMAEMMDEAKKLGANAIVGAAKADCLSVITAQSNFIDPAAVVAVRIKGFRYSGEVR